MWCTVAGVVSKLVAKKLVDRTASRTASIVNCFADVLELAETRCCMWAMPHCWSTKGERWFSRRERQWQSLGLPSTKLTTVQQTKQPSSLGYKKYSYGSICWITKVLAWLSTGQEVFECLSKVFIVWFCMVLCCSILINYLTQVHTYLLTLHHTTMIINIYHTLLVQKWSILCTIDSLLALYLGK